MHSTAKTGLRLIVLGLIFSALSGCGNIVRDIVAIPFKTAEFVAVETVKLPINVTRLAVDKTVDATVGNAIRAVTK